MKLGKCKVIRVSEEIRIGRSIINKMRLAVTI